VLISGIIGTTVTVHEGTLPLAILVMAAAGFAAMLMMARSLRKGAPA
jgi:hypothetical protein